MRTIEKLFEAFHDSRYYYMHKDGRVGFAVNGTVQWYKYDGGSYVDVGITEHPQGAKLTKIKR